MTNTILKRPYEVMDVANAIIKHFITIEQPINNQLLQKILYYSQCDYLRRTQKPLFSDAIYKWGYGPMLPVVYSYFKSYGAAPITKPQAYVVIKQQNHKNNWQLVNPAMRLLTINDETRVFALADEIAAKYRQDAFKLVQKTQQEPMWQKEQEQIRSGNMQITYTESELIAYFKNPGNWPW